MKKVYTYGVFDLIHKGHVEALKQAKHWGDKLIIGVYTDDAASGFKRKPIINEDDRKYMIEQLKIADMVIFQDEFSPESNIKLIGADIVAKAEGAGWSDDNIPCFDNCKSVLLSYTEGISTSDIIRRIRDSK